jgi:hypothetical protein
MSGLSAILFAAIETGAWSTSQLRSWAERVQGEISGDSPEWLVDLACVANSGEATAVLQAAMRERGYMLPDDFADVLVGLLCLRFLRGELAGSALEREVADVLDAYEADSPSVEEWSDQFCSSKANSVELPPTMELLARRLQDALGALEGVSGAEAKLFFT